MIRFSAFLAAALATASLVASAAMAAPVAEAVSRVLPVVGAVAMVRPVQACGWFIVLGCARDERAAARTLNQLGGPGVGGGAGTQVIDTRAYPNFRDGWFCVADGPYATRADAESIAWREAVPDAYVKNGC